MFIGGALPKNLRAAEANAQPYITNQHMCVCVYVHICVYDVVIIYDSSLTTYDM